MNRTSLWKVAVAAASLLVLGACGALKHSADIPPRSTAAPSFKSAAAWIQSLNHHGVACRLADHPGVGPEVDGAMPAACDLPSGDRLTVVIVPNAALTYQKQFAKMRGPDHVLYGSNWLVIVPDTTPAQTVQAIRDSFRARG